MVDSGRQTNWEIWFTLCPTGLGDRKTAFGLATFNTRGPLPKLLQGWRLWHFLAVFQAFAAIAHITVLIYFTIILLLSIIFIRKNRITFSLKLCKWIALFVFKSQVVYSHFILLGKLASLSIFFFLFWWFPSFCFFLHIKNFERIFNDLIRLKPLFL